MSELDRMIGRGRIALKDDKATLKTVAQAMVSGEAVEAQDSVDFPALPKPVQLDEDTKRALEALPGVFAKVHPEIRRTLSDKEINDLYFERETLRKVTGVLDGRDEAIKEIIRNHLDMDAETKGVAVRKALVDSKTGEVIVEATPRDAHGHYVLATKEQREEVQVPGTDRVFVREYRAPSTTVDVSALLDMYKNDLITKDEYLAMTRQTRVIDEGKVWDFIRKAPERGLEILGRITKRGLPGTNFNVRKVK
jgi:hypothetical protein